MYWIIVIFLAVLVILCLVGFIANLSDNDDALPLGVATIFVLGILWLFIEFKDYKEGLPKDINPKMVSILKDKEVVILRYKTFQETYTSKKEYDAISDSSFILKETTAYNVQGEENGTTYKLMIK